MTHRIKVTADHIAKGVKTDDRSCPIALSLSEHFGHQVIVDIDINCKPHIPICMLRDKEGWKNLNVVNKDKFMEFVNKFDNGKKVSPLFIIIED